MTVSDESKTTTQQNDLKAVEEMTDAEMDAEQERILNEPILTLEERAEKYANEKLSQCTGYTDLQMAILRLWIIDAYKDSANERQEFYDSVFTCQKAITKGVLNVNRGLENKHAAAESKLKAEHQIQLKEAHDHGYISGGNSAIDGHLFDSDVSARKESLAEFFKVKGKGNREMKEGVRVYRIKHIDGSIHYSDVPFAIHGADRFCKGLFFEDCDLEAFARKVWNAGRQYPQPAGMSFEEWWAREKAE